MGAQKKLAAIGLTFGIAFAGVGCSSGDVADKIAEKAVENETGGKVDIDSDGGSVKFTDDDGNEIEMDTGGGASLPDGWPEELNPPEGVSIVTSNTSTVDGKKAMTVLAEAEGTVADFQEGIKQQVTDAGFEITQDATTGTDYGGLSAARDDADLVVSILNDTSAEGKVTISMTLSEK